jgi:hypothetical protein
MRLLVVAAVVAWIAAAASPSSALPRYTARYEQKCALCHVNPSGGGLRSDYARQQLVPEEIAWWGARPKALEEMEKVIPTTIQIGADFREFYVGADEGAEHLNFFEMQADLYLAFQLDPKATLYYDRGQSGNYEAFGIGYIRPTLYVKAGRFVPSYGWKFDDHTMYVRSELNFMPPGNSDVGLEAGFSHGPFDVQAAVVNGNRGVVLDNDTKVAGVANAVIRHRFGPVGISIGASGYHQPSETRDFDTWGAYGYLRFHGVTWLGETDLIQEQIGDGPMIQKVVTSHEVTYLLRRGLEVKGTYDFFDPDRDVASGARSRYGGGVFVMPRPFMTMEALVRRIDYDDGVAFSGRDYTETLLQLHLLY